MKRTSWFIYILPASIFFLKFPLSATAELAIVWIFYFILQPGVLGDGVVFFCLFLHAPRTRARGHHHVSFSAVVICIFFLWWELGLECVAAGLRIEREWAVFLWDASDGADPIGGRAAEVTYHVPKLRPPKF